MDQGIKNSSGSGRKSAIAADYFFLLRPMILIPVWTFFLLGAYHGGESSGTGSDTSGMLAGVVSFSLLIGAVYIINQITDRKTDLENDKLFLLPREIVSVRAAVTETILLTAASFIIAVLFMPLSFNIIILASLILGMAYSMEPVRFKKRPFCDIASNAAGIGILAPLAGWTAIGAEISGVLILLPYPLAVASVHLVTTLADIEGDRSSGLTTSGVMLGGSRTIILAVLLMLGGLLASFLVDNPVSLYAIILSLPFYLVLAGRDKTKETRVLLPAKTTTLIFAISAGVVFRLFIPFLAAMILLTQFYYRKRFGISYPSFK